MRPGRLSTSRLITPLVFALLTLAATWPMAARLATSLNSWTCIESRCLQCTKISP